ncbi:unnamed protein product [Rotaria socialis]|uniref:Band 7 domain-containing protein n=3 Tax=Rotaria socialis TaxID=392032 RepID=A0A818NIQ9_9BILA|nr:unnamed protein product [Rotaria socialis]CAF3354967.1 unnamed protein product [Rotaria socialis]CAF3372730.1 unnamed protein product [Rotaria socialis]CAF3604542.1 unnamed protein product [Rotaria socialis]CAF3634689.1 unnamed protein product [Rotaria socialis]
MVLLRKIKRGRRSIVWKFNGDAQYIDGPRLAVVWPCINRIQPLYMHQANDMQFLEVNYLDGTTEVKPGPVALSDDPLKILSIFTKDLIKLDANELLVLYTQKENETKQDALSVRNIIKGPTLYCPKPNEWIHEFTWHGEDGAHKTRIIPGAKVFQKLRLIPDQFYYNITDVRTSDDALITVKLMVFYELFDVETMLNNTHDPIADFINAICADIIAFASVRKYETFLENANQLNQLEAYPQLVTRSETVGYKINKVVFRGYQASEKLQLMNDNAIEKRTKLRLEEESERQLQILEDLKLEKRFERSQKERKMELDQMLHKLDMTKQQHASQLQNREADNQMHLQHQQLLHDDEIKFYQRLKELGTDITQIMVAQQRNPDKLIQIMNEKDKRTSPNIQFVDNI